MSPWKVNESKKGGIERSYSIVSLKIAKKHCDGIHSVNT